MSKTVLYKDIDAKVQEVLNYIKRACKKSLNLQLVIKKLSDINEDLGIEIQKANCGNIEDVCLVVKNYLYALNIDGMLKLKEIIINVLLEDNEATQAYNRFINILEDINKFKHSEDSCVLDFIETHKPSNKDILIRLQYYWSEGIQTARPDLLIQCLYGANELIKDGRAMKQFLSVYSTLKGITYTTNYMRLLKDWTFRQYTTQGLFAIEHFQLNYLYKSKSSKNGVNLQDALAVTNLSLDYSCEYFDMYTGVYKIYNKHYKEILSYRDNVSSFCKSRDIDINYKFYFYIECKDFVIKDKRGNFLPIYLTNDFFEIVKLIGLENVDGFICESNGYFWMHDIKYIKANIKTNYTKDYIGRKSKVEISNCRILGYKDYIKLVEGI